jgi:sarcosine oxidase
MMESRELWRGLESRFGEELISPHGTVAVGETALERLPKLEAAGAAARRIGADEIAERQPLLADFDGEAVLDEAGGSIRTTAAIRLWRERVGDALVPGEVIAVHPDGEGVEVHLGGGDVFNHSRAVICAGRGTVALARGAGIEVPLNLACHLRATFEVSGDPPESVSSFLDGDGRWGETGVYATAYPGNRLYSIGLAETMEVREDGSVIDPTQFAELDRRVRAYARKAMPRLDPDPVEQVHCWATDLPWNEDAIGIWESDGVFAIGGHNLWKMAPVLGQALADAATGGGIREELRPESRVGEI